jgi:hypothetical protein
MIFGGMVRDVALVAAIGIHYVYLALAVAAAAECDAAAVGRPRGVAVASRVIR